MTSNPKNIPDRKPQHIPLAKRGIIFTIVKKMHNVLIGHISRDGRLYRALYFAGLRITERERLKKRKVLELSIQTTSHCNLNCKHCIAFSPVAEPAYYEYIALQSDLGKIAEVVGDKMDILMLSGGEPLLHPDLPDIMRCCRKCFPNSKIGIVTNGTLLAKQGAEFWNACHENNIFLSVSHYPVELDLDAIETLASEYSVIINWAPFSGNKIITMYKLPIDLDGRQDGLESFKSCRRANKCTVLWNGKLAPCNAVACYESFNKYFKQSLMISESDFLNVAKIKSADEIFEFLCRAVPFCRYCDLKNAKFGIPWGVSKRTIDEWV